MFTKFLCLTLSAFIKVVTIKNVIVKSDIKLLSLVVLSMSDNYFHFNPVDTGRKLNVHKTFRGRPGLS